MTGPQKVLTAEAMRNVDAETVRLGIPGIVLMENAGNRVVEFLNCQFTPLNAHRVVVVCGKGNNGGDGLVIARQLYTRLQPRSLAVVLAFPPEELQGDAAQNLTMLRACGCPFSLEIEPALADATLVIDALLGTGLSGPARGPAVEFIRRMNSGFPSAKVVAVDIPSGLASDSPAIDGDYVRADFTIIFTALKIAQALSPACAAMGELHVSQIGSPPNLLESHLRLVTPEDFRHLLARRPKDSNKGKFGHVLVVAGSRGRTGAAAMCGLAALRAGAGLVTVASAASALPLIAGHAPELMTDPLAETSSGGIADQHIPTEKKTIVATGPGVGTEPETVALVRRMFQECPLPMVVDADALNALAGSDWRGNGHLRVLTPHPGEMSRLTGQPIAEIQAERVKSASKLACDREVILVLKGERTLVAFPDRDVWINPTGSPAMATGGTGDILTGMIAGMLGQHPDEPALAIAAAVYLHGLSGELGAAAKSEQALIATDLLEFLPAAIHACSHISDAV